MKVALVYDHVNKIGGAERILESLHELFPEAPLFTPFYDPKSAPWADKMQVRTSFLQKLPFARTKHEWYPGLPILAMEKFDFTEFDVVISITSAEAKGIITSPKTLHICYLLTPTRYLWSHYLDYFPSILLRTVSAPVVTLLRLWDTIAATRPDIYVAISKTVQKRAEKYYKRKSRVIYPPVSKLSEFPNTVSKKEFYLVVSRLVRYKHIEIAIAACNELKRHLKIVGIGADYKRLKKLAGPTIEFLGQISEQELSKQYAEAKAFLFVQEEDFGITAVEAHSFGTPVIALSSGGALEIVRPGVTGELFYPQKSTYLVQAIRKFEKKVYNRNLCKKNAQTFTDTLFKRHFLQLVEAEWQKFRKV